MAKKAKARREPNSPDLVTRLGWRRCDRTGVLRSQFAFGKFDGPCRVRGVSPDGAAPQRSAVVAFTHPETGRPHEAIVCEYEVTYDA